MTDEKLQAVVDRLCECEREEAEGPEYAAGYKTGRRWAQDAATPKQLASCAAKLPSASDDSWMHLRSSRYGLPLEVYFAFHGGEGSHADAQKFWDAFSQGVDPYNSPPFLRGFVEAANDVWAAVKDRVKARSA